MDEGMSTEEALCLPCRLESLRLAFSAPDWWSLRVLRSIVHVAALSVVYLGEKFVLRHAVAPRLVDLAARVGIGARSDHHGHPCQSPWRDTCVGLECGQLSAWH
jgi:hypothetical protein